MTLLGGVQHNFDILPSASEEQYLRAYPEERVGHAFLEFCREGDIDAIVHLVKHSGSNDAEDETEKIDVLRYQGTFESIEGSGLHVAIRYRLEQVAWLLLVLGSSLPWDQVPGTVLQTMKGLTLSKEDRSSEPDIRSLKDSKGWTAADLAKEVSGWSEWVQSGRLIPG